MVISRRAACAALVFAVSCPWLAEAQRGRGAAGDKPAVDIVQSVGCAERKAGSQDTWWLTRAAEPRVTTGRIFNSKDVEAAKGAPLGTGVFQLVGVADFLDVDGLLDSGRRKEFTTAETANATGDLRPGRKILVKGLLIDAGNAKRINLISLVGLADACS